MLGYKFVDDPQHLDRGSIRLGTPTYYGRIEGERRDTNDSGVVTHHDGQSFRIGNGLGRSIRIGGWHIVDASNITITGGLLGQGPVVTRRSEPVLIFCTSWNPENELGRNSAAVFEIDLKALEGALRDARPDALGQSAIDHVAYGPISSSNGRPVGIASPFLKAPDFSAEEEVRMLFEHKGPIEGDPWSRPEPCLFMDVDIGHRPDIIRRLR